MKMVKISLGLSLLVISSLLLAACSRAVIPGQLTENQPEQKVPLGSYTTRITSVDLYPERLSLSEYLGEWELKLGENNQFTASLGNMIDIEGSYKLTTDQIAFYSQRWASFCPDEPDIQDGIYSWTLNGKSLNLSVISEDCSVRRLILATHPLVINTK